jgi:CHASE2 domain-containing sensor protein/tRNA A-37 threonylcarbamoyl transferase component Bud32
MSYRKLLIIIIAVFFFFVFCHLVSFGPLENTHLKIRDLFFRVRGPAPTNPQVTLVAIDDQSIAHYGRWPWPRARIGALIHRLTEAEARTIGIDISFLPSQSQAEPLAPTKELTPLMTWLNLDRREETLYSNDQLLALAMRKADNVVLPFYFEFKGPTQEETPKIPRSLSHSAYLLFDDLSRLPSLPLLQGSSVFPPTPVLAEAAAALGCVNAYLDRDGLLRNDPAIVSYRDLYFPSMGIQLARLYLGLSGAEVKVTSSESILLGNHVVPMDDRGFVGLNYSGGRESFPYLSYKDVMEGKIEPVRFRDKLVLVGVTAAGLHDLWSTPFGPGYPGVEKHATVVGNILDDRFIARPDLSGIGEVAFMFISGLVFVAVAGNRRFWLLWLCCLLLLGLALMGSYWGFAAHNLWFKPLFPALFVLSLTLLLQVARLPSPTIVPEKVDETRLQPVETMVREGPEAPTEGEVSSVGRYQIESELGHGAMGVVYKAVDPKIGRSVAIKTIRLDHTLGAKQLEDLKERSLREAQVAGQLSHPGIVTIYDVVEKGGHLYIAMEFIEGQELSNFCDKESLLKPRQVTTIIGHICHALDYAHKEGVVHRDIKPSNIMLPKDGRPKIMDFGITKMITSDATQTAAMLGTPSYMSPEQIDLEKVDGRSDLFSVGAMFYELLGGQRPFTGPNITAILKKITTEDPPPLVSINPQIHPKLAAVVSRLMAKSPEDRFQSGGEVVSVLKSLLEESSIWKA